MIKRYSTSYSRLSTFNAGFGGSLSTVAAFIVEIQKLNAAEPWKMRGYLYAVITIIISLAIGLLGFVAAVRTL